MSPELLDELKSLCRRLRTSIRESRKLLADTQAQIRNEEARRGLGRRVENPDEIFRQRMRVRTTKRAKKEN